MRRKLGIQVFNKKEDLLEKDQIIFCQTYLHLDSIVDKANPIYKKIKKYVQKLLADSDKCSETCQHKKKLYHIPFLYLTHSESMKVQSCKCINVQEASPKQISIYPDIYVVGPSSLLKLLKAKEYHILIGCFVSITEASCKHRRVRLAFQVRTSVLIVKALTFFQVNRSIHLNSVIKPAAMKIYYKVINGKCV